MENEVEEGLKEQIKPKERCDGGRNDDNGREQGRNLIRCTIFDQVFFAK
jgi:hypothetical protein